MEIHVRSKRVEVDETVRTHIKSRLQFNLGRFAPRILRVTVQIIDLNGPRGGEDEVCRIEIRLLPTGRIFVEDADVNLYAAVDREADRAARSVSRAIRRTRDLERDAALPINPLSASTPQTRMNNQRRRAEPTRIAKKGWPNEVPSL